MSDVIQFQLTISIVSIVVMYILGHKDPSGKTSIFLSLTTKIIGLLIVVFAIVTSYIQGNQIIDSLKDLDLGLEHDELLEYQNKSLSKIVSSGFIILAYGIYFIRFKVSETAIWKKVFKFIGAVILYFFFSALINLLDANNLTYFGVTFVFGLISILCYIIGYHKSKEQRAADAEKVVDLSSHNNSKDMETKEKIFSTIQEQKSISVPQMKTTQDSVMKSQPIKASETPVSKSQPTPVTSTPVQVAPAEQQPGQKLYCKHCGKKIDADSQFCVYCGGKL